jgi:hypothetical protein
MTSLKCGNLLSSFNAIPYEVPPLPEDMTSFGDDDPLQVVTNVDLDYETPRDDWEPVVTTPDQVGDLRLPRVFVDGALNSVEIAGSVQDSMGYARSIRAGQLGVGAISLDAPAQSIISCNFLLAITTMGYSDAQVTPLISDLQNHPRAFDLITWKATSDAYFKTPEEREVAIRDAATVRRRLRRRVTDVMLEREQTLVRQVGVSVYADGRYVDHLPESNEQFVIGVIKSMRRRYLDIPRLQVLYNLKAGERTPAFETESQHVKVVSFYARISSAVAGATNGLVRVEIGKSHFENHQQQDWSLLDAVTAHITRLKTKDSTYARAAVTLEPIQVVEQRIQRLFHPIESVTMSALNALR